MVLLVKISVKRILATPWFDTPQRRLGTLQRLIQVGASDADSNMGHSAPLKVVNLQDAYVAEETLRSLACRRSDMIIRMILLIKRATIPTKQVLPVAPAR